jgi:hypothetical protein
VTKCATQAEPADGLGWTYRIRPSGPIGLMVEVEIEIDASNDDGRDKRRADEETCCGDTTRKAVDIGVGVFCHRLSASAYLQ